MLNRSDFFVSPKVSTAALNRFLACFRPEGDELHTFEIMHHGAAVVRLAAAPYSCTDKREIYSLSKSFCSTAVGFLVDEGLLSVEDKIVDIFPEDVPENPQENLLKLRVKHVLSMNAGHASCVMHSMINAENEVRAFMEQPFPFEPGTHFAYNTGATLLLSHIVEKKTGMKLLDFLTWKLFMPLGIDSVRWNRTPDGANEGGCGIHVSVDDIAKLGLLYLNKGVWNGKRILSEAWVNEATHFVSDNSMNGTPDWCSGYGYQFWMMSREGFRGDGAFGQLCIVLPERDMVIAVQTELGDMQREIDNVMELVYHLYDEGDSEPVILPDYSVKPYTGTRVCGFENRFFRLEPNAMGWTCAYFVHDTESDAVKFVFSDGVDQFAVKAGFGHYEESEVYTRKLKPKLVDLMSTPDKERCRMASSAEIDSSGLTFRMRFLNCPHRMIATFKADSDKLTVHFESWGKLDREAVEIIGD